LIGDAADPMNALVTKSVGRRITLPQAGSLGGHRSQSPIAQKRKEFGRRPIATNGRGDFANDLGDFSPRITNDRSATLVDKRRRCGLEDERLIRGRRTQE
jgi:hypothetical protein